MSRPVSERMISRGVPESGADVDNLAARLARLKHAKAPEVLSVIPARGGSKGIRYKNIGSAIHLGLGRTAA